MRCGLNKLSFSIMCCTFLFTYRDFSKLTTTHWKLLFHRRRSSSVILFILLLSLRLFSISLTLTAGRAFESAWLGGWRTTTDRHRQGTSNQFIEQQPPPYFKSFVFVAFIAGLTISLQEWREDSNEVRDGNIWDSMRFNYVLHHW